MSSELCLDHCFNIISVQEHWLHRSMLNSFNVVYNEFEHFAIFDMNNASSSGILRGRPFGDICFLWRKSIAKCIKIVNCDPNGRCVTLSIRVANRIILIVSVYFLWLLCDI